MVKNELYISVDIESDGPIPGPYSMVSFGMCAIVVRHEDGTYEDLNGDLPAHQFYAEMEPISDEWIPEALAISGLDREYLFEHGQTPSVAMTNACKWVNEVAAQYDARPVFAAYPLGFDWMFWYWYAVSFSDIRSPFGHSAHIDMKSVYSQRANQPISKSVKRRMPRSLFNADRKHTHNGLDDAIEQGEFLGNLLRWNPTD